MKSISELKEENKTHQTELWESLNARRSFLKKEIEKQTTSTEKKILRAKRKFMRQAESVVGEISETDELFLQQMSFAYPQYSSTKPFYYGVTTQSHARILIRNNFKAAHGSHHGRKFPSIPRLDGRSGTDITDEDFISVYEKALGEKFIPPESDLTALEDELDESKQFIRTLHGKNNTIDEQVLKEAAQIVMNYSHSAEKDPVSPEKARALLEQYTTHFDDKPSKPNFPDGDDMRRHIQSYEPSGAPVDENTQEMGVYR